MTGFAKTSSSTVGSSPPSSPAGSSVECSGCTPSGEKRRSSWFTYEETT